MKRSVRLALVSVAFASAFILVVMTRHAWLTSTRSIHFRARTSAVRLRVAPVRSDVSATERLTVVGVTTVGAQAVALSSGTISVRERCGDSAPLRQNRLPIAHPVANTADDSLTLLTFSPSIRGQLLTIAPLSVRGGSIVALSAGSRSSLEFRLTIAQPSGAAEIILPGLGVVTAGPLTRFEGGVAAGDTCARALWLQPTRTASTTVTLAAPAHLVPTPSMPGQTVLNKSMRVASVELAELDQTTGDLHSSLIGDPELKLASSGEWKTIPVAAPEVVVIRSENNLVISQSALDPTGQHFDVVLEGIATSVTASTGQGVRSLSPGYIAYLTQESPLAGVSVLLSVLAGVIGTLVSAVTVVKGFFTTADPEASWIGKSNM